MLVSFFKKLFLNVFRTFVSERCSAPARRGLVVDFLFRQGGLMNPNWLRLILSLLVFVSTTSRAEGPANVILILVDDLGWMDLSCQGSNYYQTPHIDRLAQEGMRFTNAYAACAVCSPTRAAIQTGRYPGRTGVTDWIRSRFQRGGIGTPEQNPHTYVGGKNRRLLCPPNPYWMEHEEQTIAEVLKTGGYRSAHIGKWHLGDEAWYPAGQGYDENYGGCDYGQPPSYFDPFRQPNHKHAMIRAGIPFLPGKREGQYLTDREGDEAVAFIRRSKDQPFFLHLAHYAVHTPIQAEATATARYRQDGKTETNAKYAAMVESVDRSTGRILATLEELGISDRTLVLFTSDNGGLDRNGGPTDNAPLRSGKGYAYEGGIRVPFIVWWPKQVPAAMTSDIPVCSIDVLPTFVSAAGLELPKDQETDGVDLMPHLRSGMRNPFPKRNLIWHFPHYRHAPGPYSIIRQGDWKLIKFYEGQRELFHLGDDLGETRNLAEERPELVATLEADLMRELELMGAKLPRNNPDYQVKP